MARKLEFPRRTTREVLQESKDCGYSKAFEEIGLNAWVTLPTLTWGHMALNCSRNNNGVFHPNHHSVRWQLGRNNHYILASDGVEETLRIRELAKKVTGQEVGYSYGAAARALIKWALLPLEPNERDPLMLKGGFVGYHQCKAGRYKNMVHYDASACYFQLISRLESPRLYLNRDLELIFCPMLPHERSKWNEVLEITRGEKLLRNSIWGAMLGGSNSRVSFHKGERKMSGAYYGTHYAAAALVARSAWELCRAACVDTGAVYAQTDGIICQKDQFPMWWDKIGIEYSVKAYGTAHIIRQHCWKCGSKKTKWYESDDNFPEDSPMPDSPQRYFHFDWLC